MKKPLFCICISVLTLSISVFAKNTNNLPPEDTRKHKNNSFWVISVSGNIWNDANGDLLQNGVEQVINGTNAGGGVVTGAVLHVNLIDVANNVIETAPVSISGTFTLVNVPENVTGLTLQLTQNQGTIGQPKPLTEIPVNWTNTGENKNGQGGAADAAADGEITLTTTTIAITNQNFGIQRPPVSPDQNYNIPSPVLNSFLTLNGTGAPASPGPLTGNDDEDGVLGTGGNDIFNTVIIAGMNGNKLFYNGTEITTASSLNNYDPNLLEVQFTNVGSTSLSFIYQSFDVAGSGSNFALYTINWAAILPTRLFESVAILQGNKAIVNWKTADEKNTASFDIERSLDGITYYKIGTVAAAGNSFGIKNYSFENDLSPVSASQVYYRVKLTDIDGRHSYSNTVVVKLSGITDIKAWPSPFNKNLSVSVLSKVNTTAIIKVTDLSGRQLLNKQYTLVKGNNQISITEHVQHLTKGVYIITAEDKAGVINLVQKITKE